MRLQKSRILLLMLVLVLAISLVACGGKTEEPKAPVQSEPSVSQVSNVISDAVSAYYTDMPGHIYKIKQTEFVDKVKAGDDMFILDIRQPDVYAEGHVKGAVNVPWGAALSEVLDKLPQDKAIMVYCYTGQTAGQTVALLNMAGFDARSVNLGWNLGISKVDAVESVTETKANDFAEVEPMAIKPEIKEAIVKYFAGLADVKDTIYKNYKISEDNAKKIVDAKDENVIFLSIRDAEDYAKGHIEGALNIPFANDMAGKFDTLPKDKKIVVYCYTGQTAGQTVAALRMLGYDAVSLNGGMGMEANAPSGWANKSYPVVK